MEKSHCVFLTRECEVAQTSQVEKFKSHCMQVHAYRRPFPPSPLLWNTRTTFSNVKNNVVCLQITDITCDIRQVYRNSTQHCQLCKRQGLQCKTDITKLCSQNTPRSTALNLEF